ncbi:phytanoyl-CoA dioxygenase family protein [Altererythrobacter sp. KTW20L]|uniref:phytanoyl-CoA dioxygenase family protein n=1 Tax=Altererythrobacter sp. KTW20L TaxID=2942210 RepID=UPI0020BD5AFD|nr:phytanoyl-CoA dioxygenase family protein [Altererythrobacter sp. KTW20L]MCL6250408.1 phytanoyl-CoA dioxygenase family protein [Altererythrobacter sp. KTW20L]
MHLLTDGAELHAGLAAPLLPAFEEALEGYPAGRAGIRISGNQNLADLLSTAGPIGGMAGQVLGPGTQPVRAVLFDKSPGANWQLDWHQDRTIAVKARHNVPGFENWNVKQGMVHVEPPYDLLANMVTVRVHLDPVDERNGVLEVVAGSHRCGRISEAAIPRFVTEGPIRNCLAEKGDCWFYRTPILHRSARSRSSARRRVLQIDYSADPLPEPLAWRGL